MSSLHAIDPEAIEALRALSPDDGDVFLKEIITIFLEDTPIRINDMKGALEQGQAELFVRSAHSIKGSAGNLGAAELRAIAERIEHHGRREGLAGTAPMIAELEAAFSRTGEALRPYVAD